MQIRNLPKHSSISFNSFKDPFLLDVLGLKDNHLEADLEQAIIAGIDRLYSNLEMVLLLWLVKKE